eukprot:2513216-Lingulodinium_polyedra.AAC.1
MQHHYVRNELFRFVLERGRPNGILQSDKENAMRVLSRDVAMQLHMRTTMSPVCTPRSQGNLERWHRK